MELSCSTSRNCYLDRSGARLVAVDCDECSSELVISNSRKHDSVPGVKVS